MATTVPATFFELHALLSSKTAAAGMRELLAAAVPDAQVLALYPLDAQELARNLHTHLRATRGYDTFMVAARWGSSSRCHQLQNGLTFDHRLARNVDWFTFYDEWVALAQGKLDWYVRSGDHLTLNAGVDMLWLAAHWPELSEVHGAASDLEWALDKLHAALTGSHLTSSL